MKVYKDVCILVFGCWAGFLSQLHAVQPSGSAVKISIDPVPDYVCAGSRLAFHASISNVEGPAEVRITANTATAHGSGMGAASTTLSVNACTPGTMVVYFGFGEYGSFSSNVVVVGIAAVQAAPGGPVCVPTQDPIEYTAYPTDAAGYGLCPPAWSGPNVVVNPQDPWRASAQCEKGGYYYAIASLGQFPPCHIWEMSERIAACEVKLLPAFGQDYGHPDIFPNVCINAQPAYQRAKYRVVILPSDTGGTVHVDAGDVEVAPAKVGNLGTFYVKAGETPGRYRIRLEHDELAGCSVEAEGDVFRFETKGVNTGVNLPSQTRGAGTFDAAVGQVASSTPDSSAAGHGAILTRQFEAKVEAVPPGSFNGRVEAGLSITHTLHPSATIYKNALAASGTLGISAALGFLRVTLTRSGSHSIATATFNAAVQVGDGGLVDAGNFTYSSDDFVVPFLWATKVFGGIPVVQTLHDVRHIFPVGAGAPGIPVRGIIGVLCVRGDGAGTATVERAEGISSLEIEAGEDEYEIVP